MSYSKQRMSGRMLEPPKDAPKNSKPFIDPQVVRQPNTVPAIPESALECDHLVRKRTDSDGTNRTPEQSQDGMWWQMIACPIHKCTEGSTGYGIRLDHSCSELWHCIHVSNAPVPGTPNKLSKIAVLFAWFLYTNNWLNKIIKFTQQHFFCPFFHETSLRLLRHNPSNFFSANLRVTVLQLGGHSK